MFRLRCPASGCRPLLMNLLHPHGSDSVRNLGQSIFSCRGHSSARSAAFPFAAKADDDASAVDADVCRLPAVNQCTRLKEVKETMRTLVPTHELDQLSTTVERTANAAAECVRQVSIRDLTQTDVVASAERILLWLFDVTHALRLLREPGDEPSLLNNLRKLERAAKDVRQEADLMTHAKKTITEKEVCRAVDACLSAARGLTENVERILALDKVRGMRLGLRAKTANDSAQAIVADLRRG